jgi:hypothetical protein
MLPVINLKLFYRHAQIDPKRSRELISSLEATREGVDLL